MRDQLVEQKGLVEKYKSEIQSWKSKFEDQFGDKTSMEKKIVELNQKIQTLEEDVDQIGIDRDMWKNKNKELNQVHADKVKYFLLKGNKNSFLARSSTRTFGDDEPSPRRIWTR